MFPRSKDERILELLGRIERVCDRIYAVLSTIHPTATGFTISQGEINMALTPLDPGNTPVFTATPTPEGSSIFGAIPTWTSSDPTNATVTPDATGLVGTVSLSGSIPIGESVTLTVDASFTDAAGNAQSITGSVTFTIGAPPPVAATGFSIQQTA